MFKMTCKMVIGPVHQKVMKIKICTFWQYLLIPLALCVFKQIVLVISNVLQILGIQPQISHSSLEQLSKQNTKSIYQVPEQQCHNMQVGKFFLFDAKDVSIPF